jgi:predicted aldo/keto reductase-like oxidoreductase
MYIIITGDIVSGFSFHGPFDCFDEAIAYAQSISEEWWLSPLNKP